MIHHFIINPAAGKGTQVEALKKEIQTVCETNAVLYDIYITQKPHDATEYTKKCLSEDEGETHRFYACGGDGTLSEVLNGTELSDHAEIALIPIGTGNDFCRNFDNNDYFLDIKRQLDGTPRKIDVITYNGKYCANMINIGFDCDVVKRAAKIKNRMWIPTELSYVFSVIITLFKKFGKKIRIEFEDGTVIDKSLLLTAIANGQYCGGGYDAAPRAMINDGLIDLCVVRKLRRFTFLSLVSKYRAGTHLESKIGKKYISYYRRSAVKLSFEKEMDVCIDGEIERHTSLDIGIMREAIDFSVPNGCNMLEKADMSAIKHDSSTT